MRILFSTIDQFEDTKQSFSLILFFNDDDPGTSDQTQTKNMAIKRVIKIERVMERL